MAGSLLTASLAAYAFSRLPFRGRESIFVVLLAALMVPTQLTIIPIFILMRKLELIDTLAALWIPALVNVFAIFFLRQYFNTIPRDLDEAARIDGAGHLGSCSRSWCRSPDRRCQRWRSWASKPPGTTTSAR